MNFKNLRWLLPLTLLCYITTSPAQNQSYKVSLIGFYNLENLFDTINQPDVKDEEFTPTGANKYTAEVYLDKLDKLSEVISLIGLEDSPDGPAILGFAEIENRSVLKDLVKHPKIKDRNYRIVHYDSPDLRGIDVGLLYNPKYFKVKKSESLFVPLFENDSTPIFTRDILYVFGLFDGEPLHLFVNHWPSRRGGEERSAPLRMKAASIAKAKIDSIISISPNAKIILMGDLNDDPISPSVIKTLGAKIDSSQVQQGDLYNPWNDFYKKGIGTLAYNDAWNLFDQIIISSAFLEKEQKGLRYRKAVIFSKPFMFEKTGRYKGYPKRTYSWGQYIGGYSDHFPTYIVLVKKVK
jgi:hypothetical protein